jgi:peptidyl-prolyl cis-trans isomerase A (cyclophilin A)
MRAGIMVVTAVAAALGATAAAGQTPDAPHDVLLDTEAGVMILDLDYVRAPITACNFARYVQWGDYGHGGFFRSVVAATNDNPNPIDVIQAATPRGSDDALRPPIPLERTSLTGLSHVAGAVSMARDGPDTATSSFFIVTQDAPSLDFGGGRNPDGQGFAVFGRVAVGLDVARAIQMRPTDGQEQLTPPVRINAAAMLAPPPEVCAP